MKRFQECNKLEKIFRYRWYIAIPFIFIWYKIKGLKIYEDKIENDVLTPTDNYYLADSIEIWKICKSEAQRKMKWYYTMEDIKNILKKN